MRLVMLVLCGVTVAGVAGAAEDFEAQRRVCHKNRFYDRPGPGLAVSMPVVDPLVRKLCEDMEARAKASHDAALVAQPADDLKVLQDAATAATQRGQ